MIISLDQKGIEIVALACVIGLVLVVVLASALFVVNPFFRRNIIEKIRTIMQNKRHAIKNG